MQGDGSWKAPSTKLGAQSILDKGGSGPTSITGTQPKQEGQPDFKAQAWGLKVHSCGQF